MCPCVPLCRAELLSGSHQLLGGGERVHWIAHEVSELRPEVLSVIRSLAPKSQEDVRVVLGVIQPAHQREQIAPNSQMEWTEILIETRPEFDVTIELRESFMEPSPVPA